MMGYVTVDELDSVNFLDYVKAACIGVSQTADRTPINLIILFIVTL